MHPPEQLKSSQNGFELNTVQMPYEQLLLCSVWGLLIRKTDLYIFCSDVFSFFHYTVGWIQISICIAHHPKGSFPSRNNPMWAREMEQCLKAWPLFLRTQVWSPAFTWQIITVCNSIKDKLMIWISWSTKCYLKRLWGQGEGMLLLSLIFLSCK